MIKKLIDTVRYHQALSTIRRSGVWFVDIPRTSSSSVRAMLHQKFGHAYGKADILDNEYNLSRSILPNHLTAKDMRSLLGNRQWNKLQVFSIVRNPWDRHYALYRYRKHVGEIDFDFPDYIRLFRNSADNQHPASPYHYHGHHYQCWDYLSDGSGNLLVDHIVKFETREKELKQLGDRLGLDDLDVLHLNRLPNLTPYREVYDQHSVDVVAQISQNDIARFGYSF